MMGSPYEVLAPGWDPCGQYPYLYPPSSWPLLVLAGFLPYQLVWLGALPLLRRPPRLVMVLVAGVLLFVGLGPGLWFANVNVIITGLLCLSFLPRRWGGIALAAAVAIKGYPVVLLPFLWKDRARLVWFSAVTAGLVLSGTILLGLDGWAAWATTLLHEGPHCDPSLNPFAMLGPLRVVPAGLILVLGWWRRSPTLALLGATFFGGVVTRHYLPTFVSTLPAEPLPMPARRPTAEPVPADG